MDPNKAREESAKAWENDSRRSSEGFVGKVVIPTILLVVFGLALLSVAVSSQ